MLYDTDSGTSYDMIMHRGHIFLMCGMGEEEGSYYVVLTSLELIM